MNKRNITRQLICLSFIVCQLLLSVVLTACSSDNDSSTPAPVETAIVETLNVDVIMPVEVRSMWQSAIDLAIANIEAAQKNLPRQVKLNLRYHDESASDLEQTVYSLCYPKEGDDTCHLILGPYRSSMAEMVLANAAQRRVPVMMPDVTSDEVQRIMDNKPYAWFMTESDVTACEAFMNLGSSNSIRNAALIYSNDRYGNSFRNWFGYMATEFGITVSPNFLRSYISGQDMTDIFEQIEKAAADKGESCMVLIAVSSDNDYKQLIKQVVAARDRMDILDPWASPVTYFVSDVGDSPAVYSAGLPLYGLSPAAATMSGFDTYYYSLYKENAPNGAAQVYDALMIAALGAAKRAGNPSGPDQLILDGEKVEYRDEPYGPNLSDWMRALVADKSGTVTTWTVDGLNKAFRLLSQGQNPNLTGATGKLLFDSKMHNTILQTTYWLWMTYGKGERLPLITFSTHGDDGQVATLPTWEWQKLNRQDFEDVHVDHDLPYVKDHWALVVSPSTTWANYRHQADVFAVYQTLRQHGYDDDHIVLICEDNLANAPENKYPGKIYVDNPTTPDGSFSDDDNVRKNAVVDYHFTDLQMDDIRKIILGDTDGGRLPQVLRTTAESNLFIFWSGHGADGKGMCWSDGSGSQIFTGERMRDILKELNDRDGYRRCMLAIETCFSGLIGEAIVGLPDVVAITAANTVEPSKADVHNRELGVFLSNAFSRAFRISINDDPYVTLRDLFYNLARTTTGSHVTLYNDVNYGSVYSLNASDYFPE